MSDARYGVAVAEAIRRSVQSIGESDVFVSLYRRPVSWLRAAQPEYEHTGRIGRRLLAEMEAEA